jgi:hypothetical protein
MENNHNVFINVTQTFMINMMFDYLEPPERIFSPTNNTGDLFNMMQTCKSMKMTMMHRMIKMYSFPSSQLYKLGKNITYLRYLYVDDSSILKDNVHVALIPNITRLDWPQDSCFNEPLKIEMFPTNLKKLILGSKFNQELDSKSLPQSLEELKFGWSNGVSSLVDSSHVYTSDFKKPLNKNVLPSSLRRLSLGSSFNCPLKPGVLPRNLKILVFGINFNQKIKPQVLPRKLETLVFGRHYNQKIEPGVLPIGLTQLALHGHFNQKIKPGILPLNLIVLVLGKNFKQEIEPNILPPNLKKLMLNNDLSINRDTLPSGLTVLVFGILSQNSIRISIDNLPPKLVKLQLSKNYDRNLLKGQKPDNLQIEYV